MKESLKFLKSLNIEKKVVVACSGGPDSMCLLHLLNINGYKVVCAHVNHNLRKESDEEYKFVEKYCKSNNIIFEGMKINGYKNNKFTEEEAREKRYSFFEKILKKYNINTLVTAHHTDDLIETILMRIIRGSNLRGYKGFSKVSRFHNYLLVRPLIFYSKKEIENYVKENDIPFVIDDSNYSKKYTRNRIRLDILPILKNENILVHKKFLAFSEELNEAQKYIDEQVDKEILNNYKDRILDLNKFNDLNKYIQKKEIEKILFIIYNENITEINKKHIDLILNLINNTSSKKVMLPKNLVVKKEYNKLIFLNENKNDFIYSYKFDKYLDIEGIGEFSLLEETNEKSNYVIKLNSKEIKLPIIIRTRNEHDKIEVKNMNGQKKVSRIFIDEKLKSSIRNIYPIVTDSNNNILWIPGIKKSKFDCSNGMFYDIIIKYTKKGE